MVQTFTGGLINDELFFFKSSIFYKVSFGVVNVCIRFHVTPPFDLFFDFGRLLTRHQKFVQTFTGGVMDDELFFFKSSSFYEVILGL